MRVVVTGAAGFLGSYVVRELLRLGHGVAGVDSLPSLGDWTFGDITKPENLLPVWKGCDAMVHLAAMAAPGICEANPSYTFEVNVRGTYNVLKLARDAGLKKVVFASSAHVYGISPRFMPTTEAHPLALQDTYTTSKILGEKLCELFYENDHLPYVALRQYNGYGPGQSRDYFIPATIRQAVENGKIVLRGRSVTKDFVYVEDMATAIAKVLQSNYVGPLNVGTGVQTSLEEVARIIAAWGRVPLEFSQEDVKGPTHMQCDTSRMRAVLGWAPSTSVKEGLSRLLQATIAP